MSLINRVLLESLVCSKPLLTRNWWPVSPVFVPQIREYAARKGTREKRAKKKVKVEVQKVGFIPHNERNKEKFLLTRPKRKFDDSWKQLPIDNVYPHKYYQWPVYAFQDAVQCHRETHHPDMCNKPQANLHVSIELNTEGEKKTRFVDNFVRIAPMPHKFDHGEERNIIAFTKDAQLQEKSREAGAQLCGGIDLIKQIQNGAISLQDFQFYVADPAILPDLVALRGVMRRKFPNPKSGTLDADLPGIIAKFMNGINYTALKDEYEKDFGLIQTVVGTLDMEPQHLEANFASLLQDVMTMKPKRSGIFIRRCLLWSPPTSEKLKVDHNLYLQSSSKGDVDEKEKLEAVAVAV